LGSLKNLTSLELRLTAISDVGLKNLAPLQNLDTLYIDLFGYSAARLRVLREIGLLHAYFGMYGKDHSRPKSANDVTEIWLVGVTLTHGGLNELRDFKNLRELVLHSSLVTDEDLKDLAQFKKLDGLFLGDTKVTDRGLKELAQLKTVTALGLEKTAVTAAGLKELANFKNLTWLNLVEAKVTRADVDQLEKALPNCKIQYPWRIIK
jgi:internalin A